MASARFALRRAEEMRMRRNRSGDLHNCPSYFRRLLLMVSVVLLIGGIVVSQSRPSEVQVSPYAVNAHDVNDIFFLNSRRGWICLQDGKQHFVFRTTDGGRSWLMISVPEPFFSMSFFDRHRGWALTTVKSATGYVSTQLFQSKDAGLTWKQAASEPEMFVSEMAFVDPDHGWFVGEGVSPKNFVLSTTDGGRSLRRVTNMPKGGDYEGIFALRGGPVWIFGKDTILSTRDEGRTWAQQFSRLQPNPPWEEADLISGTFLAGGRGWIVGQGASSAIILSTADFGNHWRTVFESQASFYFEDVSFWDEAHGCAVGLYTKLYCTQDGGKTWTGRNVLPSRKGKQADFFIRIVMLNSRSGFVLRAGGFLYKTRDGGQTWREFDPLLPSRKTY